MELKISESAKKCIKNKLSQIQGASGLLITFVEYKSCCGAAIKVSNASIIDLNNVAEVVPIARDDEGITVYTEKDSDFFETDYTLIKIDTQCKKHSELLDVQFE
ncbi:MAG: hypothetical protein KIH08_05300 [Candidatus Freyarchaeota archaeon]|nr:hypothetical protein [Candidatus Jordarchaeia archaeon]MBS7269002.1 hypothetical protein [Candidatus Jordarchaeia archaeon]MBS7279653.1 hypothetical protein [Candidatus Jordarchaeia archaeon]